MTRRQTLVALALVAAMAVAVPSIAAVDDGFNFKRASQQARKLAHKALKKANKALKKSGQPGPAGPAGGGTTRFAQAPGAETTAVDNQYVQLPGGPSLTVNVPSTGIIQVAAQAVIGDDAGAVALFQDGAPMPGQSDACAQLLMGNPGPPLFASPDGAGFGDATWSTPATFNAAFSCANAGPAGPVMFNTSAGSHTYELRYAYCGCAAASATFSERKLWITTHP